MTRTFTVIPINKIVLSSYYVAIPFTIGWLAAGSPSMAHFDTPIGTNAAERASSELNQLRDATGAAGSQANFSDYSYSSAEFRQSLKQIAANPTTTSTVLENLSKVDPSATNISPLRTSEQIASDTKIFDPCQKIMVDKLPPPPTRPMALESVKDRDPELYRQIQAKVADPRYTGELGNITVSTHDAKGRVNGCTFIQNVPYWQSGPAAQALVNVNLELGKLGKHLESDPLNGAGRTLGQEEAIVWRNSGLHAKVGKSNHGFGRAVDFKTDPLLDEKKQIYDDPVVNATLHANGWRQGDTWGPLRNDLHHWSFTGPGPAHDGPPPSKTKPKHGHHK